MTMIARPSPAAPSSMRPSPAVAPGSPSTLVPTRTQNQRGGAYAAFISHCKVDAAMEARYVQEALEDIKGALVVEVGLHRTNEFHLVYEECAVGVDIEDLDHVDHRRAALRELLLHLLADAGDVIRVEHPPAAQLHARLRHVSTTGW